MCHHVHLHQHKEYSLVPSHHRHSDFYWWPPMRTSEAVVPHLVALCKYKINWISCLNYWNSLLQFFHRGVGTLTLPLCSGCSVSLHTGIDYPKGLLADTYMHRASCIGPKSRLLDAAQAANSVPHRYVNFDIVTHVLLDLAAIPV